MPRWKRPEPTSAVPEWVMSFASFAGPLNAWREARRDWLSSNQLPAHVRVDVMAAFYAQRWDAQLKKEI